MEDEKTEEMLKQKKVQSTASMPGDSIDPESGIPELQVKKLRMEWYDIGLKKTLTSGMLFKRKSKVAHILKNISGVADPGELLAIMGPSGGGKTSLLNCLSRRIGISSGQILLNGRKVPRNFNKISAYVMQDDRLFEVLTPRELFTFSANLRLPRDMTAKHRKDRVEAVIRELKMDTCANTRVGGALMRGLSGGERKRTAIGYELITNPSLIFLDEPTSGLDSSTACALLQSLKDLSQRGHTVICTIHQPSSEIFRLFDKLTLLVKGEVAFFGRAEDSITHFAEQGFPCPMYTNPADFFMDLLQTQSDEEKARARKIVEGCKKLLPTIPTEAEKEQASMEKVVAFERPPFPRQLWELVKRGFVVLIRNPLSFRARIMSTIIPALLVGAIYWKLPSDSQSGIGDRIGALFFITNSQVMNSLNGVLLSFPLERYLLIREQTNGMYGVTAYYLGKYISNFPFDLFIPILYSCIVYWLVGFNAGAVHFFKFLLAVIGINFGASSLGLFLGCMLPNAEVAVSLAPVLIIPFMLFAGFYVSIDSIPVWLRWLQYLSLFKWGFQALVTNEFANETFSCQPSELLQVMVGNRTVEVCPVTNGNQVLTNYDLDGEYDYWIAIGVLLGLYVGFRIVAYFFLQFQTKRALSHDQ